MLIRSGQLMRQHRSYAEPLDYSYEETFWTWFWGAWWEQQPDHKPEDTSACALWKEAAEQKQCQTWSAKAHAWIKTREANRPQ